MCKSCYKGCFIENTGCCHCYTNKYYNESIDDQSCTCCKNYYLFPATTCTIDSCVEYMDGETSREYNHNSCCNDYNDPPCHDCSCIFCPIGFALDIICIPFRVPYYTIKNCSENNNKHENTINKVSKNNNQLPEYTESVLNIIEEPPKYSLDQ